MSEFWRNTTIGTVATLHATSDGPLVTVSMFTMPRDARGGHPFVNTGLFLRPGEAMELAEALRDAVAHVTPAVVHVAIHPTQEAL